MYVSRSEGGVEGALCNAMQTVGGSTQGHGRSLRPSVSVHVRQCYECSRARREHGGVCENRRQRATEEDHKDRVGVG